MALFSDIGSHVYVSTENILPDKQGVASFGTTDSSERVTYFQAEDVLVSNIRPYFKKMWFATTSGGCNADVLCFRALDKKYAYLLKSIMFQDGFFDYVMSGAKGTKMPRGDKTHIMLYPIPRFSETQLLKFIEYNKISFGEGGRMRSLSRVSRKQRYNTLDFAEQNRVPTGMLRAPIGNPASKGIFPSELPIFSSQTGTQTVKTQFGTPAQKMQKEVRTDEWRTSFFADNLKSLRYSFRLSAPARGHDA